MQASTIAKKTSFGYPLEQDLEVYEKDLLCPYNQSFSVISLDASSYLDPGSGQLFMTSGMLIPYPFLDQPPKE